jgi:hypothetical protein
MRLKRLLTFRVQPNLNSIQLVDFFVIVILGLTAYHIKPADAHGDEKEQEQEEQQQGRLALG